MLDVSLSELLLTAVVAFLVMDPKDIPRVLREVMGFFRMLRDAGEDVKRSVMELAEEDVRDIQQELKSLRDMREETPPTSPRYIVDEAGNFQEVYDVSELMETVHKPDTRVH